MQGLVQYWNCTNMRNTLQYGTVVESYTVLGTDRNNTAMAVLVT